MEGGDSPYRVAPRAAEPPRDAGIVGDVIGQFADPYAFYRELVQNAIDAGSPTIEVRIDHDDAAGVVRASVRDTGEGMTRAIIEDQLLVLFRSTKEKDDTKIGKFGIGFASVLSPQPNIVVVHTARDGRRHTLHLYRDLSYELFDAGPATRPGTTVELEIPIAAEAFGELVAASRASLLRWCRHATVPIHLVAHGAGGVAVLDERIDRPLALDDALVETRMTSDDGLTTAIVGITSDASSYAGFFDHGLTLYEGVEPGLDRIAFKVQDSRLAHTLSRDNVRRDTAYAVAMKLVLDVAQHRLPAAALAALRAAAEAGNRDRYSALASAAGAAGLRLDPWWHLAIEPVGGRRAFTTADLGDRPYGARAASPITAALAAAGVPVIDLGTRRRWWTSALADQARRAIGRDIADVERELIRIAPVPTSGADLALLGELTKILTAACGRAGPITMAILDGGVGRRIAITADRDDAIAGIDDDPRSPWLIERTRTGRRPFGLFRRPPIVIHAGLPQVQVARALAATDPVTAGSLLARLVLITTGALDRDRSQRVLDRTLTGLGVGGGDR